MKTRIENMSLAEIVTSWPAAATLFENRNLDFCCRGKQKLNDALLNDKSKLSEMKAELKKISKSDHSKQTDFTTYSLSKLIDYIIDIHHKYVKESLPVIQQHLKKVVSKHGKNYPEMKVISELFEKIKYDFEQHMLKEELILFPKIKAIESEKELSKSPSIQTIIKVMEREHEDAGKIMEQIRKLSNGFTPPENVCFTFRLSLDELKIFETDLHKHVHLENNILFPRVITWENKKG